MGLRRSAAEGIGQMHRAVLSVRGSDAAKLLHSLSTNDVHKWLGSGAPGLAAAFLTTKGRILADAVLWRGDDESEVLVDCPAAQSAALLRHLKMYKLRSSVKLAARDDLEVATFSSAAAAEAPGAVLAGGADPRTALLGGRGVAAAGGAPREAAGEYARRRLALGVAEGPEVVGRIPLNCNLELLNYVAFDKGCYLGQELTARAKFRGEVRRRLMPCALQDSDGAVLHSAARALPPPDPVPDVPPLAGGLPDVGAKLVAGNKAVGELVAVDAASSVAVAMLKLDFALSGEVLDVDVEGGQGVKASPYVPPWWPGDVLENAD